VMLYLPVIDGGGAWMRQNPKKFSDNEMIVQ
jgi:hypothetical protein